jgi:hypothetical protein
VKFSFLLSALTPESHFEDRVHVVHILSALFFGLRFQKSSVFVIWFNYQQELREKTLEAPPGSIKKITECELFCYDIPVDQYS